MFHFKAGTCVSLTNGFKTAIRVNPTQEFNRGLVFSLEPLKDNELFEVKIDKKLHTWNGSIEVGVTVCNPDVIEIPITATDLRGGTWIMLGQGVLRDGRSLHEAYGNDLDKLVEGDRVGVMRASEGELHFFINGVNQGVAASNLPSILYAVIDMYGKCSQITLTNPTTPDAAFMPVDPLEESFSEISNKDTEVGDSWEEDIMLMRRYSETDPARCRPPLAPTASEEASLTEPNSTSALTNHVANISIANSFISTNDSNGLDDCMQSVDGCESIEFSQIAGVGNDDGNVAVTNDSNIQPTLAPAPIVDNGGSPATQRAAGGLDSIRNGRKRSNQNHLDNMATYSRIPDRLCFHSKCGSLVKLSTGNRTAERKRPFDEFNNGVVMSNRALLENELFQIRIDRLVDKWSGSIEMGISTHNPDLLDFPATMTNMRSGTIMMSGTGILTNGKGTLREYGDFNLDELKEGDRIGMIIKEGRYLHYFINGIEQGVASNNVPSPVWAVVDLYGMTVKVTILNGDETDEMFEEEIINGNIASIDGIEEGFSELLFHPNCGNYAAVINSGKTAHRPHASEDFNNGVVLTERPLLPDERFEVQLDVIIDKWAGSLEVGVTTHGPTDLEFPSTMTNVRSGTWLMTSSGVTYNGTTIIETYGRNSDIVKVGECVGVCRKMDGSLHFYINNQDQGVAATNVPEKVYGIIDLYGAAAQATILQNSTHPNNEVAASLSSTTMTTRSDLKFHPLHGRNAHIMRGGLVAVRPNATSEFNDAIVMSNRQLKDDEMFEVVIDRMVDRWSGSLEAGMTAIAPEQIIFPSTMTDIDYETWMLSGSSVMRNGYTIHTNCSCDLDSLRIGTRIGMMRHSDRSLHYCVNGEDQGKACENLPLGLWAVIDLYGQCGQVSMVLNHPCAEQSGTIFRTGIEAEATSVAQQNRTEVLHRWSKCCGANVNLNSIFTVATRVRTFNHGLVFSATPVEDEEIFEVKLTKVCTAYAGSIKIGLTSLPISETYAVGSLPSSLSVCDAIDCWWIDGSSVRRTGGAILKLNYCPSLSRLREGDRVGVKKTSDGNMKILINSEDYGVAASNVSKDRLFAVVELTGSAESVCITSTRQHFSSTSCTEVAPLAVIQESIDTAIHESKDKPGHDQTSNDSKDSGSQQHKWLSFHENSGRNIQLSGDKTTAFRIESYNQGIVLSARPLPKNVLFQVKMGTLGSCWSSSLMVGVTSKKPEVIHLPNSAFDMKKNTWIICGDSVFFNGVKIKGRYGPDLDSLSGGSGSHVIGIMVDVESRLHLYVNGVDQGVAAKDIPAKVFAVFDLYGRCHELLIKNVCDAEGRTTEVADVEQRRSLNHTQNHHIQQLQHSTTESDDVNQNNEINTLRRDRCIQFPDQCQLFNNKSKKIGERESGEGAIKNCEYQNVCCRFKFSLALPESYFVPEGVTCFCETCHKIRDDGMFHCKGQPPQRYAQPVNWCRFALVSPVGENNDSWHMAYHGTVPGAVRRMLDRGELLFSGELGPTASVGHRNAKHDDSDGSVLYFSPFVDYASLDAFATSVIFTDDVTNKEYDVKTVLQVAVEPGSYKMASTTFPFRQVIDSSQETCGQNVEWITKERGATQLLSLLVKITNRNV